MASKAHLAAARRIAYDNMLDLVRSLEDSTCDAVTLDGPEPRFLAEDLVEALGLQPDSGPGDAIHEDFEAILEREMDRARLTLSDTGLALIESAIRAAVLQALTELTPEPKRKASTRTRLPKKSG